MCSVCRRQVVHLAATLLAVFTGFGLSAQEAPTVARAWNELLLEAIREDLARPTVHARNLFHVSSAMYDAWAAYDEVAEPYLLGKTLHGYEACALQPFTCSEPRRASREKAISYAAYRLIQSRFRFSPGRRRIMSEADALMVSLGYVPSQTRLDYNSGDPAALGNYVAQCYIEYGLQDGSNEQQFYRNTYYLPVNPPLVPDHPGNPEIIYPDRWQPLQLELFIDQGGNPVPGGDATFLSPEWGDVTPFALEEDDLTIHARDGATYRVYHDPGPPPRLASEDAGLREAYQWGFTLVSVWGSHLDPSDGVVWDISPGAQGNGPELPDAFEDYPDYYKLFAGGDASTGHALNPVTGQPYAPQLVPRGDFTRVLAEFWADGPDSETPPGHWFVILNYVNDQPQLRRKFGGAGDELDRLEWDVKSYWLLGGAMHDAAISAWSIKGYYDYVRPISALRYMADRGQSSDPDLPHYHPDGIPLFPGYVELVEPDDPLAGVAGEHVGKIKLYTWRGHRYIADPAVDVAGVGWILAEDWWPYQRPSFVTPPFAGYVSGHSTYSRAAAEVLTLLTGDPFFPGGMAEFPIRKNEFLVFEEGPSQDFTLQWATYRDASDQTSLSRIWGGIHPPADDIPGRKVGIEVGHDAFALAADYFRGEAVTVPARHRPGPQASLYPNPHPGQGTVNVGFDRAVAGPRFRLFNLQGQLLYEQQEDPGYYRRAFSLPLRLQQSGVYLLRLEGADWQQSLKLVVSN